MSHARDIKVKKVQVELDRPRTIKFDLNAFIELEEMYGSIDGALKEMEKGSIKAVRAILWAGLIHEDESLTLKQVGSMVDMDNLPRITEALSQAISDSLPEKEQVAAEGEKQENPR